MKIIKIINKSKNQVICEKCLLADTFILRLKGLIGENNFTNSDGLLIKPCNSIHMFFMKFAIDALFIDKSNIIVYTIENIKPWQISKIVTKSYMVLEIPSGTLKKSQSSIGDIIYFE